MGNKELIRKEVEILGMEIGCYNERIEKLSKQELGKVLENIEFQSDTDVRIGSRTYVVEIDHVDNEVDLNILTKSEYINRYGNERYKNE